MLHVLDTPVGSILSHLYPLYPLWGWRRQGECLSWGLSGESYQGLIFNYDSAGCYLDLAFQGIPRVQWNSSAKFSTYIYRYVHIYIYTHTCIIHVSVYEYMYVHAHVHILIPPIYTLTVFPHLFYSRFVFLFSCSENLILNHFRIITLIILLKTNLSLWTEKLSF